MGIAVQSLSKSFGGHRVLRNISFSTSKSQTLKITAIILINIYICKRQFASDQEKADQKLTSSAYQIVPPVRQRPGDTVPLWLQRQDHSSKRSGYPYLNGWHRTHYNHLTGESFHDLCAKQHTRYLRNQYTVVRSGSH